MIDVLETGLMKMGWYGGVSLDLNSLQVLWCWSHLILIIVIVALACKIFRSFVFVRGAKLEKYKVSVDALEEGGKQEQNLQLTY